jgi:hypothetical protein
MIRVPMDGNKVGVGPASLLFAQVRPALCLDRARHGVSRLTNLLQNLWRKSRLAEILRRSV